METTTQLPVTEIPKPVLTPVHNFYVAGVSHRPANIIDGLASGQLCQLVYEPENEFDKNNAIRIEAYFSRSDGSLPSWEKIGYVPKKETAVFHLLRKLQVPVRLSMAVAHEAVEHRKILISAFVVVSNPECPFL